MKKRIVFFASLLALTACKKDLTSLNVDPKNPQSVPSYTLFTEGERLLTNTVTSSSVNLNIFRLIEQQWTETQYLNESLYQITYRRQPDGIWSNLYTGSLQNLERAKTVMATDVTDAGTRKNETAMADILQVYTYYYLLTTFGNVPYTQALDISKPFPVYDDAKTTFNALLTRLTTDINNLDVNAGTYSNEDIIYGGDITKWKKFGYSLELKMGITISDSDPTTAAAAIKDAIAKGIFASNDDSALVNYDSTPPNTNPVWVDLVQSQRHDFVATSQFLSYLNPTSDPRIPYFFNPATNTGTFVGADNGSGDGGILFSDYSLPGGQLLVSKSSPYKSPATLTNPDFPGDLLDYSETQFYLAEAVAKGLIPGDVATYYKNAVIASVTYWTGDATAAASYYALPNVTYATASNPADPTASLTPLQKIAVQEYISLYNRGWDAWTTTRRLDYPVLIPPTEAFSAFPVRFTYPISEQNVNQPNYEKASTAIGGDKVTTRLWFDTKAMPTN